MYWQLGICNSNGRQADALITRASLFPLPAFPLLQAAGQTDVPVCFPYLPSLCCRLTWCASLSPLPAFPLLQAYLVCQPIPPSCLPFAAGSRPNWCSSLFPLPTFSLLQAYLVCQPASPTCLLFAAGPASVPALGKGHLLQDIWHLQPKQAGRHLRQNGPLQRQVLSAQMLPRTGTFGIV